MHTHPGFLKKVARSHTPPLKYSDSVGLGWHLEIWALLMLRAHSFTLKWVLGPGAGDTAFLDLGPVSLGSIYLQVVGSLPD